MDSQNDTTNPLLQEDAETKTQRIRDALKKHVDERTNPYKSRDDLKRDFIDRNPDFEDTIRKEPEKFKRVFDKQFEQYAKQERDTLRQRGLSMYKERIGGILTQKDLSEVEKLLSDKGLEEGGAMTAEKKLEWLHENVTQHLPKQITEAARLESEFKTKIATASQKGWITPSRSKVWLDRLNEEVTLWKKKQFLTEKFPKYYKNWEKSGKDYLDAKSRAEKLDSDARKIPEIKALLQPGLLDLHYEIYAPIIDSGIAAMTAYEDKKMDLHDRAKHMLNDAVKSGAMAQNKVGTWMRRIFESSANQDLIRNFLTGTSNTSLSSMIDRWKDVRKEFDAIEEQKNKGVAAGKFHFVNTDQFLNWHYAARLAYIEEFNRRIKEPNHTEGILWDIRREMDMKDWDHAQYLIDIAKKKDLSAENRMELQSMQRYLTTQRTESRSEGAENGEKEKGTGESKLFEALAELQGIHSGVYNMYVMAIERGLPTVSALGSILYNRVWCHNNHIYDENGEQAMRDNAIETTRRKVLFGHDKDEHENNYVPGYGEPAVRKYDGEWKAQTLFCDTSVASQRSIVNACEAQANNEAFKYWTTLIPDELDMTSHRYIVSNIGWKIKAAVRSGETMKDVARVSRGTSASNEAAYALAG